MQILLIVLGYLGSAAGATLLIAIGSAVSRVWSDGRPRQRIAAIRAAAETRNLLTEADELAVRAVEGHMFAEAARLQAAIDRANALIVKREQREPWRRSRRGSLLMAGILLLVALTSPYYISSTKAIGSLTIAAGVACGLSLGWSMLSAIDTALARRRAELASEYLNSTKRKAEGNASSETAVAEQ